MSYYIQIIAPMDDALLGPFPTYGFAAAKVTELAASADFSEFDLHIVAEPLVLAHTLIATPVN